MAKETEICLMESTEKQLRNQGPQAPEATDKVSAAQQEYIDQVARLQQAAASNPLLNGKGETK